MIMGFLTGPRVISALEKFVPEGSTLNHDQATEIASLAVRQKETANAASSTDLYESLHLEAKSVYVWDSSTGKKLYGKNEYQALPLASVTKMMMALVAVELLPQNTQVSIAPIDLLEEGDTGLFVGEKWALLDLLKFTLVASSNDGASAIASVAGASLMGDASSSDPFTNKRLFIKRMNDKAQAIGLMNTKFSNESGLDLNSVTAGAYGSARDMAMLFEYISRKHPELFTATTYNKLDVRSDSNVVHHVANTNAGVEEVTGLIGSKTGYTDLAGGNLVVVVDIGVDHPVVIAVLGSTRDGRFTDVNKLIDATVHSITGDFSGISTSTEESAGSAKSARVE